MKYTIKDKPLLRKLLWLDAGLGGSNALLGLLFFKQLTNIMGLSVNFILVVSIITLCYAIVACVLANQRNVSVPLLRVLILANWIWTFVSLVLLFLHFSEAQPLGRAFLILQVVVVGGLAYFENKQLVKQ
ncbi:MAG TPA: hypothetical protein VEZ17_16145 [Chitinophagaceae bacterium]|nr:hypothetical protein [Chitinophagaceae bacterium]